MNEKIAIVAGTYVDTKYGTQLLREKGCFNVKGFPVSKDPITQHTFQLMSAKKKHIAMSKLLEQIKEEQCKSVLVYCNSLSASVDFTYLSGEIGLPVVTPLDVYQELAPQYKRLAVITANAQGLAGIEKVLYAVHPEIEMMGSTVISAVTAIESGESPYSIVERLRLAELANWYQENKMEALLLGCTHFPYFKEALMKRTLLPVIDPADDMIALLKRTGNKSF